MPSNTPENDARRRKLLTELAAILQMGGESQAPREEAAPSPEADAVDQSPIAELRELGLPVDDLPTVGLAAFSPHNRPRRNASIHSPYARAPRPDAFVPLAPTEFRQLRLANVEIESLVLKFLLHRQNSVGRDIAQHLGVNFGICEKILATLKLERLVVLKGAASLGDYVYELSEAGLQRARKFAETSQYFGTAPVCLEDYTASVAAQSLERSPPDIADLRRAFEDLTLGEETFERLGRAIISGKGLFLHGPPGNGKTSVARRVTEAYGEAIWIPRAISAWGEIIRVYDPSCHEELPPDDDGGPADEKLDRRWVRIRRPTIVVGGELLLDNLEITSNPLTGVSESPLQLKSNCGTLVIDDFGRQQIAPATLLNRWIIPLEKRYDFLNLLSGRKIKVPFDQFVIFSTNLEPRHLVDEAFLRRIPYKVDICGPTEAQFRTLFLQLAQSMGIEPARPPVEHLIDKYYRSQGREMRFCHPRDLLRQVKVYYEFQGEPARLTSEAIDAAAADYFSVL